MNFVQQFGETMRSIDLGSAIGASGFKTVDLVILVMYLVVLVALGLFLGRTKKGEETRSCECGELQSRGVPVIEHTYKDATCISAKTCSECGQTSGEPLGHDYNNATCTAPKTCNRCAETIGEALGHYFVDANCTTPKTCTVCSTTIGEALGHNFAAATCTTPKTCTLCEKTTGEALGHNYIEATCTEPKTCSDCGKKYGSAVGHSYLDATCTAPQTCSACGHTKGSPIAHNISSTTSYCTNCGKFGLNEVYATRMAVKSTIDWLNTKSLDGYEIYSIYYAYEDTCTCPNCLEDGGMGNPYINVIVFFEYTINGETDIWVNVVAVHDYYGIYYMLGGYRVGFAYYYKGKELTKIFSEDYSIYYEKEDLILVPAKNVL